MIAPIKIDDDDELAEPEFPPLLLAPAGSKVGSNEGVKVGAEGAIVGVVVGGNEIEGVAVGSSVGVVG